MNIETLSEAIAEIEALSKDLNHCYEVLGWHNPRTCDCTTYESYKMAMGIIRYLCHKCERDTQPPHEIKLKPINCSHKRVALTYILSRRYCVDCGEFLTEK